MLTTTTQLNTYCEAYEQFKQSLKALGSKILELEKNNANRTQGKKSLTRYRSNVRKSFDEVIKAWGDIHGIPAVDIETVFYTRKVYYEKYLIYASINDSYFKSEPHLKDELEQVIASLFKDDKIFLCLDDIEQIKEPSRVIFGYILVIK